MLYSVARQALFATDPERAHQISLEGLRLAHRLGATRWMCKQARIPVRCMGLEFSNPVGVAAGLDKNAEYFEALAGLGFGFVEVGTVTPRAQPGNPGPRVFRLPQARALINRLGFNNKGVDHLVRNIANRRSKGVLGVNIGKNRDTPVENAAADYLHCLEKVFAFADYVTVNVSSPNTSGLRELQTESSLDALLTGLAERRRQLAERHGRSVPLAVKVAPDLQPEQISAMARVICNSNMDAVIATNTTISRQGVEGLKHAGESGGLSGAPLRPMADAVLQAFRDALPASVDLIGVGGICSGADAIAKLDRGASLVQFYTGMIYRGPELLNECLAAIGDRQAL